MTWEAWFALTVVALVLVSLARNWGPPDVIVICCLALVVVVVVVVAELVETERLPTAAPALDGFANPAVLTVGTLFVVVAGLVQIGAMARFASPMMGRPKAVGAAQARLIFPVAGLSAFHSNTPILAMFLLPV